MVVLQFHSFTLFDVVSQPAVNISQVVHQGSHYAFQTFDVDKVLIGYAVDLVLVLCDFFVSLLSRLL